MRSKSCDWGSIRAAGGLALMVRALAGCESIGPNPSGEVILPEATRRVNASAEREAQLRTATSRDDIPELTGAPGPDGRWPAPVPGLRETAYRDARQLVVGSEGPYALTR